MSNTAPTPSHLVGVIGEGHFIAFAAGRGWCIYRGFDGHMPADFVVDTPEGLLRVETKRVQSVQEDKRGRRYVTCTKLGVQKDKFDFLFLSTPTGNYWIPVAECPEQTISVRVDGPSTRDKYEAFRVV